MKSLIRSFLKKAPCLTALLERRGKYPPGHFYSPVPDRTEVRKYIEGGGLRNNDLSSIDLNGDFQFSLLQEYCRYYGELPFPEQKTPSIRYYYENIWYSYADAIFLYCFLRKHEPRRIIEVGSGFSSAVILDTTERFCCERPETIFVEPFPDRLKAVFAGNDVGNNRIIEKRIQDVPIELFEKLEPGDLLFIDSTHVMKCGGDLQVLMFDILPILPPGVFVHFHDIFYPFEYPEEWLLEGRDWNENYVLRAFLAHNKAWVIYFFNSYAAVAFRDFIRIHMPLCARNPGGSLYVKRK